MRTKLHLGLQRDGRAVRRAGDPDRCALCKGELSEDEGPCVVRLPHPLGGLYAAYVCQSCMPEMFAGMRLRS